MPMFEDEADPQVAANRKRQSIQEQYGDLDLLNDNTIANVTDPSQKRALTEGKDLALKVRGAQETADDNFGDNLGGTSFSMTPLWMAEFNRHFQGPPNQGVRYGDRGNSEFIEGSKRAAEVQGYASAMQRRDELAKQAEAAMEKDPEFAAYLRRLSEEQTRGYTNKAAWG